MFKRTAAIVSLLILSGLAHAQTPNRLDIKLQQQKDHRDLTVKFVAVIEDSRCPQGAACIWAGNAKIKLEIRKGRGAWKTVELNTTSGSGSATIDDYEIKLVGLDPYPGSAGSEEKPVYTAKIELIELRRN